MNTDRSVKRVLIYGDSLVFGKVGGENRRYEPGSRFTGLLQDRLGNRFEIIESGLRGRTLYGANNFFAERDGLEQFGPTIGSQLPLDYVVIILGTNDANCKSKSTETGIQNALSRYRDSIKDWVDFLDVSSPRIIVTIPPNISKDNYDEGAGRIFGSMADAKLKTIQRAIENWAELNSVDVIDLRSVQPGEGDGIHLDYRGNQEVAELLAEALKV